MHWDALIACVYALRRTYISHSFRALWQIALQRGPPPPFI